MRIRGQDAWTAESGGVIRRTSLKVCDRRPVELLLIFTFQTGATLQLFKGHTAPVTALELYEHDGKTYLISGSWDKVGHNRS